MARSYVLTGDPRYEKIYKEILAIREGEQPRPDGRSISLESMMEALLSKET